jgi:hypothetical protein
MPSPERGVHFPCFGVSRGWPRLSVRQWAAVALIAAGMTLLLYVGIQYVALCHEQQRRTHEWEEQHLAASIGPAAAPLPEASRRGASRQPSPHPGRNPRYLP